MNAPTLMPGDGQALARLSRERSAQAKLVRAITAEPSLSPIQSDALTEAARLLEADALVAAGLYLRSRADGPDLTASQAVALRVAATVAAERQPPGQPLPAVRPADALAQVVAEGVPELPGFTRRASGHFCQQRDGYLIRAGVLRDLVLDTERAPDVREALAAGATVLDAEAMRCERAHADLAAVAALIEGAK